MSHAQGNDMITEDPETNTRPSESPTTTPPNTGDTDIDLLLFAYTKIVAATYQQYADGETTTSRKAMTLTDAHLDLKAAITKKQMNLLIAELLEVKGRSESHLNQDGRTMRRAYLESRIAELQANKENLG